MNTNSFRNSMMNMPYFPLLRVGTVVASFKVKNYDNQLTGTSQVVAKAYASHQVSVLTPLIKTPSEETGHLICAVVAVGGSMIVLRHGDTQ